MSESSSIAIVLWVSLLSLGSALGTINFGLSFFVLTLGCGGTGMVPSWSLKRVPKLPETLTASQPPESYATLVLSSPSLATSCNSLNLGLNPSLAFLFLSLRSLPLDYKNDNLEHVPQNSKFNSLLNPPQALPTSPFEFLLSRWSYCYLLVSIIIAPAFPLNMHAHAGSFICYRG